LDHKRELVLYTRTDGPICYRVDLLAGRDSGEVTQVIEQLLNSNMSWYWQSSRSHPPEPQESPRLPEKRDLTPLTRATANSFLEDLGERDLDEYMRFIALFGFAEELSLVKEQLRPLLEDFCAHETGPLRVAIIQIGDSTRAYVFVWHEVTETLEKLLADWGISKKRVAKVRPYKDLRLASLESVSGAL
jgi:hypothetical protein